LPIIAFLLTVLWRALRLVYAAFTTPDEFDFRKVPRVVGLPGLDTPGGTPLYCRHNDQRHDHQAQHGLYPPQGQVAHLALVSFH